LSLSTQDDAAACKHVLVVKDIFIGAGCGKAQTKLDGGGGEGHRCSASDAFAKSEVAWALFDFLK
jgi:hypothetical protein